jgi:hypothetical protein
LPFSWATNGNSKSEAVFVRVFDRSAAPSRDVGGTFGFQVRMVTSGLQSIRSGTCGVTRRLAVPGRSDAVRRLSNPDRWSTEPAIWIPTFDRAQTDDARAKVGKRASQCPAPLATLCIFSSA